MAEKFTGFGSCQYGNGEYRGEIVDGIRQGYGVMNFSNYDIYDGDWHQGKMHGVGTYKFWDTKRDRYGSTYEGEFNLGNREGHGKMTFANGDVYIGAWQNDRRTGDGTCWFANGDIFHGLWRFDKMLRGVYRSTSGVIYDGEIKDDKFNGLGKLYLPNGSWYEGIFENGKLQTGFFFTTDGKFAEYKDGKQL